MSFLYVRRFSLLFSEAGSFCSLCFFLLSFRHEGDVVILRVLLGERACGGVDRKIIAKREGAVVDFRHSIRQIDALQRAAVIKSLELDRFHPLRQRQGRESAAGLKSASAYRPELFGKPDRLQISAAGERVGSDRPYGIGHLQRNEPAPFERLRGGSFGFAREYPDASRYHCRKMPSL